MLGLSRLGKTCLGSCAQVQLSQIPEEALSQDHTDHDTWLRSSYEEKRALVDNHTYVTLTLAQYRELRRTKNAPKAIPTMYVLTVKKDENLDPDWAKS